jgi:RimJ/RimL family protein N-acetyltransferase
MAKQYTLDINFHKPESECIVLRNSSLSEIEYYVSAMRTDQELLELSSAAYVNTPITYLTIYYNPDTLTPMCPIGMITFYNFDSTTNSIDFGISIWDRKFWNKHCGRAAVIIALQFAKSLNIARVNLSVNKNNIRAIRCYEACNFKYISEKDDKISMAYIMT